MDDFQAMEIDDAINRFYDEDLIEELHQNFNSPGKFSVISRRAALAALVSAGLIVATGSTVGSFSSQKDEAEQRVDQALSGPNQNEAKVEVKNYLNSMEAGKWSKVQTELGVPAKKSIDLSLDNKVEVANHRAELNAK